jgi:heat shock protein HslJ
MTPFALVEVLGLAGLLLVGCAKSPQPSTDAGSRSVLLGTAWRLEDLGGAVVLDRVEATLEFPEEGRAAGNGTCNRFFGTIEIKGETISLGPLASSRMACAEPIGNQEAKYLEALQGAERFTLDGATLSIYSKGMEKPLRFVRKNP